MTRIALLPRPQASQKSIPCPYQKRPRVQNAQLRAQAAGFLTMRRMQPHRIRSNDLSQGNQQKLMILWRLFLPSPKLASHFEARLWFFAQSVAKPKVERPRCSALHASLNSVDTVMRIDTKSQATSITSAKAWNHLRVGTSSDH